MFTRNAILRRSVLLLFALFFCFLSNASGQLLTLSCSPTTGPTQAGVAYSATCTASGGIAPYTWSISSGTLPDGLALTTSSDTTMGTISGAPTTAGPYDYTLQATDSTPVVPMTAQQEYSGAIAPNITSINPATTAAGGPDLIVTVNGAGFGLDSVVDFNSTALATTVVNSNQVTATITADLIALAGSNSITLISAGQTSNTASFTVTPTVSSVLPSSATAGGPGFLLMVTGTGFETGATVNFSATSLTATVASPTQLSVMVPGSLITTPGPLPVSVTSGGQTSNSATFTVVPAPVIGSLSPPSTPAGGPAFTLTVNGSGFGSDAVVNFNGTTLTTIVIGATQVTALVPASLIVTAGTFPVTVTTGGVTSNIVNFTANPVIGSLSPPSTPAGGSAFTLTVNGSGFGSDSVVNFNGTALTGAATGATQVTASVPASLIATAGTFPVTVTTGGVTSNSVNFTVPPAVSSISPTSATAGGPDFTLIVNGSGFTPGAVVQWNGSNLATSFVNATQLTAPVLVNLIATPGTAQVTVLSGGLISNAATFTVLSSAAITSITPATVTAGGPAFTLTVNGSGFGSDTTVQWNGSTLSSPSVLSSSEVTVSVPASLIANVGSAQITVKSGGVTSNAVSFAVVAGPTLASISPSATTVGGPAFTLTVNGTGFTSGAVVQWNSTALSTTFKSAAQLTAAVPSSLLQSYGEAQITVVSGGLASNALPLSIGVPAITLTGLQSTPAPTQQLQVGIQLANPSPTALTGTLQLSFSTTAPGVPAGYIDPALQFAAGGTTLNFTIPAGSTSVSPLSGGTIQQGTVEGTITVKMTSLTSGGTSVLPSPPPTATVIIPQLPPVITAGSAQITNLTASGFDVVLSGYSTTRDMTSANFTFTAASGTQFTGPATFTVPLTSLFSTWFSSADGQSNGSMFLLTVPFTISGDTGVLQSVSVTLTNSVGTSVPASASQ